CGGDAREATSRAPSAARPGPATGAAAGVRARPRTRPADARRSSASAALLALRLQHFGVFQESVESHRTRGEVACPAVEEVALEHVEAEKDQRRIEQQPHAEQRRLARAL